MNVTIHAEKSLVALTQRMTVPASVVIERLRQLPSPSEDIAIEVDKLKFAYGDSGSNGDRVVVVVRSGRVVTAMLRRSWNQPFDPAAFRVERVESWT